MWVAKNDITGQTYGKSFKSIYDCQKFIDTKLMKIQLFWGMAVGADNEYLKEEDYDKWFEEKFGKESDNLPLLKISCWFEYMVHTTLANGLPKNPRNNVIRCWNTSQKRYATGFDF